MWTRFKNTINHWKNLSKQRTQDKRNLRAQVAYYRHKSIQLARENDRLRRLSEPQRLYNHHYPVQMIALSVFIVVHGGSLRCAAASAHFLASMMGWEAYGVPSHTMVRNWVLRCGLHIMHTSRDLRGEVVCIIDESIQIGREKLLLLLGVPLHVDYNLCAPLTHEDVQVLGMEVQSSWTSDRIVAFMQRFALHYPHLRINYVISDRGTSILAALKKLELPWVSDCTHEMMNIVKGLFSQDQALSSLCAQIGTLRRSLALTQWNVLLPPSLRDKDRFLRIFTLVDWARRMDEYWEQLPEQARTPIRFYRKYDNLWRRLTQIRDLVAITCTILKSLGLSSQSHQQWKRQIDNYRQQQPIWTQAARKFVRLMQAYFLAYYPLIQSHQRLLCCSDIIESIFGRYKNKNGMKAISADVLVIPLYKQDLNTDFISKALQAVSQVDLEAWELCNVCHNFIGNRKAFEQKLKTVG